MGKISCFRIDHRSLVDGDTIVSPGDHIVQLDSPRRAAEQRLRAVSPDRHALRASSLYAFRDLDRAEKYFLFKKGSLYELQVDDADVRHAADMQLVNHIANSANEAEAAWYVERYWAGDCGAGDYVELLVASARVTKCLYSANDKKALLDRHYAVRQRINEDELDESKGPV